MVCCAILSMAFTCDPPCYQLPPVLSFQATASDSSLLFDSIENVTERQVVWTKEMNWYQPQDSLRGFLSWNPERNQTTFCFYSRQGTDTLVMNYNYEEEYSDGCDYYFDLKYVGVARSDFENMELLGNGVRIHLD